MLEAITHWHWFIAGTVLIIAEMLLPGFFLLWLGIAAVTTGIAVMATAGTLALPWQMLIFALVIIFSVIILRKYRRAYLQETDQPMLNEPGQHHIGRTYTLTKDIIRGRGRLDMGESSWAIYCDEDLKEGEQVIVTEVNGATLVVRQA